MKLVYENTTPTNDANSKLNLLSVFRNEEILLPYFIDYYQTLGVTQFNLIDNQSTDKGSTYLQSRKDINLRLFHTDASYRDAFFGTAWLNQCMSRYCSNEFCLRVDIDELFLPHPQYSDLQALVNDMKVQGSNTLPALMLDIYPETLNNDYQAGMPFSNHSRYFDRFNAEHFRIRSRLYQHFYWIEGGFRARYFNTSNILQKFPLVKNVFNNSELRMGPHFFYQGKQAMIDSPIIRLHKPHSLLLHYKFLKPDILGYLVEQVENNEHWNNSEEYRKYYNVLKNRSQIDFYDSHYSMQYKDTSSFQDFLRLTELIRPR